MSEVVEMDIKPGQSVASVQAWGAGSGTGRSAKLKQHLPTFSYLEKAARRRIPGFAFDYVDGGTGEHLAAERNRSALDAVQIIPRYGRCAALNTEVELFGRRYASPIGIGTEGPDHVAQLLEEELRTALAQHGACTWAHLRNAAVRHSTAWQP